jgi:beta-glucosidase
LADVLVAKKDGAPNLDFHGKLSFSWPKTPLQFELNPGDPGYDPLFAYGYGLTYGDHVTVPHLNETPPAEGPLNLTSYYTPGKVMPPWKLEAEGAVTSTAVDSEAKQEGALRYAFTGAGRVSVKGPTVDLMKDAARLSLQLDYRLDAKPKGRVKLLMGDRGEPVEATEAFNDGPVGQWTTLVVPLSCFQAVGAALRQVSQPFVLDSAGPMTISISGIRLGAKPANIECPTVMAKG